MTFRFRISQVLLSLAPWRTRRKDPLRSADKLQATAARLSEITVRGYEEALRAWTAPAEVSDAWRVREVAIAFDEYLQEVRRALSRDLTQLRLTPHEVHAAEVRLISAYQLRLGELVGAHRTARHDAPPLSDAVQREREQYRMLRQQEAELRLLLSHAATDAGEVEAHPELVELLSRGAEESLTARQSAEVAHTSGTTLDHALARLFLRLGPPPEPTENNYAPASSGDGGAQQ
ncbi:hypothetical protein OG511_02580 [Streptomyces sp. NBC_01453]|uniref:hypothetical protein n=1 Tax=Streptomyces sp. NBC_01453 TaxID=2903873 RepID=UPI002E2A41C6|nr:hypothetical protein [Streptomyces sp. NBC_01453]